MGLRVDGSKQLDLVAASKEGRPVGEFKTDFLGKCQGDENHSPAKCCWNEDRVLLDVGKLVERPEKIIPSFVWFEAFKDRDDLRRDIIFEAAYLIGPVSRISGEGEGSEDFQRPDQGCAAWQRRKSFGPNWHASCSQHRT